MKKIVVLTGAGISAESGLKTFRDSGGLWEEHRIEDVATFDGWQRNPLPAYVKRLEIINENAGIGTPSLVERLLQSTFIL
jgi:NAD-dependent SIR2 family protein deacetylase